MTDAATELQQLEDAASRLGLELGPGCHRKLLAYLDLLYQWNDYAGLTRVAREDAVRVHLVDSLTSLLAVRADVDVVDLGSGAGLPGIPLALARPGLAVALVDSKRRKCNFLRTAVRELEISNCEVLECDAGALASAGRRWDTVVARAFRQPQELLDLASGIALRTIVMMTGPTLDPRELELPRDWQQSEDHELELPGGTERRRVLRYDRS